MTELLQTFHQLVRVEIVLWNAVDSALRGQCDLTLARFEVMQVISRRRSCRVLDIAGDLHIGWSGTSKIVDRVAAAGHCRRRPNPDDARSSLITLTPAGRSVLGRAGTVADRELRAGLGDTLDADDLDTLARSLSRLHDALAAHQTRA